jgi:hypothetical protein
MDNWVQVRKANKGNFSEFASSVLTLKPKFEMECHHHLMTSVGVISASVENF